MRNVCFKKGLVVGIIILFIGMSVVSSVSSRSISSPFEMLLEHGAESEVNDKPFEDYKEVITFIDGVGDRDYYHVGLNLGFLKFNLTLGLGQFEIYAFTRNPFKLFYQATAKSIHMKIFFGIDVGNPAWTYIIYGFAFGDITWEPY